MTRVGVLEVSVSEPEWSCIIVLEMLSPTPLPPLRVVKKGTKRLSTTSGVICGPLFVTSIVMFSFFSIRAVTSIFLSLLFSTASTAFLSRLTTTCRTWFSSAKTIVSSGSTLIVY